MLRFVDVTTDKELLIYQKETALRLGVHFPLEYLKRSRVVALVDSNDKMLGGYALVMKGPFRVIQQIPDATITSCPKLQKKLSRAMEITGLWLDASVRSGFHRTMLWVNLLMDVLLSGKTHFVYSYDASSKKLGAVYGACSPTLLYEGPVAALEGMNGAAIEYVEIGSLEKLITSVFRRPHFFIQKIFVPRKLHLNRMFLKKVYSYSVAPTVKSSVRMEKIS